MRRLLSLGVLLFLAVAGASLVACGGESEKTGESATPIPQATATPEENAARISLNDVPVYPAPQR